MERVFDLYDYEIYGDIIYNFDDDFVNTTRIHYIISSRLCMQRLQQL